MTDPRPSPRISSVAPGADTTLSVAWEGGDTDTVDLAGWIARGGPAFRALRDRATFHTADVADYGFAIRWNQDDDLSIDSVHIELLRDQQRPFDSRSLVAWQARMALSNQEAADLLGIRLSTLHNYKTGATRIPRGVQIACRATERDPLLFEAHYKPRYTGRPAAA